MKKMNKKGFTIVELVIVIAVIAILAGVMIPTFSGVIERANNSARVQIATAAYKDAYAVALSDGVISDAEKTTGVTAAGITFVFTNDTATNATGTVGAGADAKLTGYEITVANGVAMVTEVAPAESSST